MQSSPSPTTFEPLPVASVLADLALGPRLPSKTIKSSSATPPSEFVLSAASLLAQIALGRPIIFPNTTSKPTAEPSPPPPLPLPSPPPVQDFEQWKKDVPHWWFNKTSNAWQNFQDPWSFNFSSFSTNQPFFQTFENRTALEKSDAWKFVTLHGTKTFLIDNRMKGLLKIWGEFSFYNGTEIFKIPEGHFALMANMPPTKGAMRGYVGCNDKKNAFECEVGELNGATKWEFDFDARPPGTEQDTIWWNLSLGISPPSSF